MGHTATDDHRWLSPLCIVYMLIPVFDIGECHLVISPMHMCMQVPLFDMEVRAPPGLRALGSAMFDREAKV